MSEAAISGFSAPTALQRLTPMRLLVVLWTLWSLVMIAATREAVGVLDLGDTDNYMRLAEWRDFLAGQNWFDLHQHRFIGPEGGDMHFSRLPDAVMSAPYQTASPLIGGPAAEQFVLIAYPPLLFLLFLFATATAANKIAGGRAAVAAIILTLLASALTQQFVPGRIDHHGLALVLCMAAFAALLASFERPRFAAGAAIAAGLAVAVSLETAPVAAAAFVALTLRWIGSGERAPLRIFGLAMLLAAPMILIATLGGAALSDVHCDAFAAPAAAALIASGALAVTLSFLPLKNTPMRAGAAFSGAILIALALLAQYPHCAGGPFEGMDPLVRRVWLSSVGEVKTPLALLRDNPGALIAFYGFPAASIAAGLVLFLSAKGGDRPKRIAALVFVAAVSIVLVAAVRGATLATAFAIVPFSVFLAHASRPVGIFPPKGLAAFLALFLIASPASYVALGNALGAANKKNVAAQSPLDGAACDNALSVRALGDLPASLLFTPIDLGPAILVQTDHSITAAPYHRNDLAMRRTIEFFTASEDTARAVFRQSGAEFLIFCPSSNEAAAYRKIAPDGLAARLTEGRAPDWLSPVEVKASIPIRIYRSANP